MKNKLGKNMKHALEFANKHKGWHSYAKDRATVQAIQRLEKLGLIKTNIYRQFKKV